MNEVTTINHDTQPAAITPMQMIAMAVQSKADPAQLEKLTDLAERWAKTQAAERFSVSLAKFQSLCPIIQKKRGVSMTRGASPDYHYASLEDIMRIVQPILAVCELSVTYSASINDKGLLTATCLVRCGSHSQESSITLPVPSQMRVNDTQKLGAALQYAKRYALCAALNITVGDEDNDASQLHANTITDQQAITISDMLEQLPADVKTKLLAWAKVEDIYDIPASMFDQAVKSLKSKLGGGK